jgi:hypothetical protein
MKINASRHPETGQLGSVYVQFTDEPIAKTVPAKKAEDPEVLIDLDKNNRLVGVEVLSLPLLKAFCKSLAVGLPPKYASQVEDLCQTT